MQPTFSTCGQACIAMIAGKSVEEVIRDMKTDGATSIGQLIEILDFYGIGHAERNKRISKKNPAPYKCSILTIHTDAGIPIGRCFMIINIMIQSLVWLRANIHMEKSRRFWRYIWKDKLFEQYLRERR